MTALLELAEDGAPDVEGAASTAADVAGDVAGDVAAELAFDGVALVEPTVGAVGVAVWVDEQPTSSTPVATAVNTALIPAVRMPARLLVAEEGGR